jgi:Na+/H+ antiporter NhaD/arsenite permease-like protein
MDLAWISLAALLVVIACSCTTSVNPGVLALALAWGIGVYLDPRGSPQTVLAGFPTDLFLTLAGVTLLFTQAHGNGTLDAVARAAVRLCRGNTGLVPVMFFLLTFALASSGAGNIAAAALIAPMAMAVAERARIPAFLMTVMVAHGSLAGALSPFAPTGIIADQQLTRLGLGGHEWEVYLHNLLANTAVALAGYFLFGGRRLFGRRYAGEGDAGPSAEAPGLERRHVLTLAALAVLLVGVLFFQVHVGMGAYAVSVVLTLGRLADEREAVRKMPWGVILMVCGVTVLTALLGKTGGTALFAGMVRAVSTPETVPGVVGFFSAFVSVYSSTSGVVLPAFLPLAAEVGGEPLAVASAIIVAGHLVDSSPLSTIGALCVACAAPSEDRRALFNRVLAWGLAMVPVGALGCWVCFGLL